MATTLDTLTLKKKAHKLAVYFATERKGFKIIDDAPKGFELVAFNETYWDDQLNDVVFLSSNFTEDGKPEEEMDTLALRWIEEHPEYFDDTRIRHDFINVTIWDDNKVFAWYRDNMFID